MVVVGVFQYTAMASFNSAVNALNDRMAVEDKDLMTQSEAEAIIGKAPDDAGSDFQIGTATYTKKTYTWKALIKSYTLTAYYTKGNVPALHHTETEGAKYEPETKAAPAPSGISAKGGGPGRGMMKSGGGKKSGGGQGQGEGQGRRSPQGPGETPGRRQGEGRLGREGQGARAQAR